MHTIGALKARHLLRPSDAYRLTSGSGCTLPTIGFSRLGHHLHLIAFAQWTNYTIYAFNTGRSACPTASGMKHAFRRLLRKTGSVAPANNLFRGLCSENAHPVKLEIVVRLLAGLKCVNGITSGTTAWVVQGSSTGGSPGMARSLRRIHQICTNTTMAPRIHQHQAVLRPTGTGSTLPSTTRPAQ